MSAKDTIVALFKEAGITVGGSKPGDITVHDDAFYSRVFTGGSLALGESYMDGLWDARDLDVFFHKLLAAQIDEKAPRDLTAVKNYLQAILTNRQDRKRAWHVGKAHYDIGNDLYTKMLDAELVYSCAYWKDAKTLDAAQIAKFDLICRKLGLKKGDRVLEIGSGWGGFGRYASRKYGVLYTGINNSKEQYEYAKAHAGKNSTYILEDYRVFAEDCKHKGVVFDAIVSVGMFEHVGYKNYKTYLKVAHQLLKENGKFLLHTIGGLRSTTHTDAWIEKYIFPNSMLPSIAQVAKNAEGLFVIEDLHNFGVYYDRTLMAWFERFDKAWPQLRESNPKYDERFYRMWKYYLLCCAGSFRARKNQLWQFVLAKNPQGGYASIR